MLNKIRKPSRVGGSRIKQIFAYVFFGLICLILTLFMPVTSQFTGSGSVAYVGKEGISPREYNLTVESMKAQYGDRLDKAGLEETERLENQIQKTALNQLTDIYVISQAADREGFFAPEKSIQEQIQADPAFQLKGRFSYFRYRELLKSNNISPLNYEDRIRRQILFQDWRNLFFMAFPSNTLEEKKNQNSFKMKIRFAVLDEKTDISKERKLQVFLEEGTYSEAEKILRALNVKWKEPEEFSPSYQKVFQFDNSETLLQAVLSHIPKKGFIPRIVHSRGKRYVAEVLSLQSLDKTGKPGDFSLLLNYANPLRAFSSWMEAERRHANIRINEKYFAPSSP